MKSKPSRVLGAALLSVALCLQVPLAHAGIVTTDQLAAPDGTAADRAKVQAFLERASVQERIVAMGIDGIAARNRVAALDDREVHALAEKIDTLPSGGNVGSFTNDQVIIVLLVVILAVLLATA